MTQEQLFRNMYVKLSENGKIFSPRGLKVLEIENFSIDLPPYYRWINFTSRKLNVEYTKREFLWYLRADNQDISICEYAKLWKQMINDRGIINSNYGQYIFGEDGQFDYVVEELKKDKDSRRASMMILSRSHIQSNDADRPCTYALNFRIRDNKLNMSVHMRSNDAIYGSGNDFPAFSFIHEMMFKTLQETYSELEYGIYHHCVDSFHIYEKHFPILAEIVAGDTYSEVICPPILNKDEVDFLRRLNYNNIPSEFKFTNWINTINNK
jgi:thymidylate synthase